MRMFGILSLCVAFGCGSGDPASGDDESSIQGGRVDANDPAVGLVWFEGGGFCSGTLIAPDVVLTAAHCTIPQVAGFYTGPGQASQQVGVVPVGKLKSHKVTDQATYPGYSEYGACPSDVFDLGLVKLARPITDIKPKKLAARAPKVGAACRIVGYGQHTANGIVTVEQKRSATITIADVLATSVQVAWKTGNADHGDSGGPLLCNGILVADTSCGMPQPNGDVDVYYARVDAARDWITHTMKGWE